MTDQSKKLVAVLTDLMFTVKIQDAAKRAGLDAVFVKSKEEALAQASMQPAVMILDLNHAAAQPLDVITELKSNSETSNVRLLGYVSHVQTDLRQAAQERGCDLVIARSVFTQNLPALLQRYTDQSSSKSHY